MARFTMKTREGLRAACREAERRLDQDTIEESARFLRDVQGSSDEERISEAFLHRIWDENPLGNVGNGNYDVSAALSNEGFRPQFHELTSRPLPDAPSERAARLDEMLEETLNLVQPFVPPDRKGYHDKPKAKTTRAFAALFPNDFTAPFYDRRRIALGEAMGADVATRRPARASRWILDRLLDAIGAVDRSDWHSVAQRMKLPRTLLEVPSELARIAEHFESIREAGKLVYDQDMVESLHLGLWARERRHFAVLTGLSGTGKTQLAVQYTEALTGQGRPSNDHICTIAVQPGWYDPTPPWAYPTRCWTGHSRWSSGT